MDEKTLRVLEYEAVKTRLEREAGSALAKELVAELAVSYDARVIEHWQAETSEARALLERDASVPLGGVHDLRRVIARASKDAILEPTELLEVVDTAAASRRLRGFLLHDEEVSPLLSRHARRLGVFRDLEEAVDSCLTGDGEVRDDASPDLVRVRQRTRALHQSIYTRLERMVNSSQYTRMIQESIITIRNERFCLPIRSEFRAEFQGIVHDSSASGATVFMEPLSVVETGNEYREAQRREEEEIRRILLRLSHLVGARAEELTESLQALAQLDFIFARGKLSRQMEAVAPIFNCEGVVDLRQARHPLLTGDVIPIDLRLGEEFDALVITGPNTGGKTVALKTIGLLTLMAQSGLHIPAAPGSRLALFGQVFADIGDEQSLQQSLSTFSSHMTQIVTIMREVKPGALVLLDEIGAGTDPAEGAALAKAILTYLLGIHARTVVTTHYGELKAFAYTQEGIANASVEFDPETLRPVYRLLIGLPGSSNAFAIAARLGLQEGLLRSAQEMIGAGRTHLDRGIEQVEQAQRALNEERRRAEETRRGLERIRSEYETKLADLDQQRTETLAVAHSDAKALVNHAREVISRLLEELRRSVKEQRRAGAAVAPGELRAQAKQVLDHLSEEIATTEPEPEPEPEKPVSQSLPTVSPGEPVFVRSLQQAGRALSTPDEESEVEVQVGILHIKAKLKDLERSAEPFSDQGAVGAIQASKAMVPAEIHLLGRHVEDAMYELEKYLDDAYLAGHPRVRVIHGIGTGALRAAVAEVLTRHPEVRSFRAGERDEGGTGVTVAELSEA